MERSQTPAGRYGGNKLPDCIRNNCQRASGHWRSTTLVLGLAYSPNFRDLYSTWNDDPNYSHGKLVIPIALFILWRRLSEPSAETASDNVRGIMVGLGFPDCHPWRYVRLLMSGTPSGWKPRPLCRQLLVSHGLLAVGHFCGRVWPAIVFLVFLLPLPGPVNELMALPLQRIAASGSCFLLQLSGFWAIQEGNVINLANAPRSDAAGRSPRLQWVKDADDHGRNDYGDDHSHPYADLEADYLTCQHSPHRHA